LEIGIHVGGPASGGRNQFESMLVFAQEAEKLGVDKAWSAEAWGMDAISPLAFLAARTERMRLGTGIMQVCARTPASTAMAALSMQTISGGRFLLGLGNSGPQVVEGLHGVPFERPLVRMRETVEVVRMASRGEKLVLEGDSVVLPRPGGQGKALRLAHEPTEVPVYLATLAPRALEMTGAIADGWLGTAFSPDAPEAHLAHIRRGAEKAGRKLEDLRLSVGVVVAIGDDLGDRIEAQKAALAFQLSAMGSPTVNFYNDAYARSGFSETCERVRRLWLDGDRKAAIGAVPEEMVRATTLFGDAAHVRRRIELYRDCGINEISLQPTGRGLSGRLDTLGQAVEIIRQVCA